ncbi:hypothetical protein IV498_15015 [Paenarthrobacter sp. Z7-10]|uniref:hypothetical protein n=1 Tax=Paenarthrobacter sp. Z7-10 TaxID=2787635 RepID=UPI0022A8EB3A|nr:hypothetical protein [Paenarthrobacter sp. Z7-10]MCZ2404451.1 hypothetical protein [Paenarthrobacter sp. Z7-10]
MTSGAVFALIVLLLAIGATYFFCIRPMRKGNCAMGKAGAASGDRDSGAEAARLKTDIAALKEQSSHPVSK